jgi:hypothetical protein
MMCAILTTYPEYSSRLKVQWCMVSAVSLGFGANVNSNLCSGYLTRRHGPS